MKRHSSSYHCSWPICLLLLSSVFGFPTLRSRTLTATKKPLWSARQQNPTGVKSENSTHDVTVATESVIPKAPFYPSVGTSAVDTLENYANDVAVVLKKLRSDARDPALPPIWKRAYLPSFTRTWTQSDWAMHTSRWRYMTVLRTLPRSRLLQRMAPLLFVSVSWSIAACWFVSHDAGLLSRAVLPLTPLSLVSTFVAGLLTLRGNQGLSRLNEGRMAFGKVVLFSRDMAQIISATVYPKDKQLGLKAARHVAIFSWLLKNFLREGETNSEVDEDIVRTMLSPEDADYVLTQRKMPVAVVTRLRQICSDMHVKGKLTTAEADMLETTAHGMNECIMVTERIQSSPIPPLYTSHMCRLLMFYLFFLPLALRGSGLLNTLGTIITSTACGYSMFGLDEISHLMEEPFRLMPLWHLSKISMMDAADALVCQPPPLRNSDEDFRMSRTNDPPYW